MRKILVLLILVFAGSRLSSAQEFSIRSIELTAEHVIVHYDLVDSTKDRTYMVFLYSSADNFTTPLNRVSGDVSGTRSLVVKPGAGKHIYWSAHEEFGPNFKGDVELEVRGKIYIPFVTFEGFADEPVRKRGIPFMLKWSGGASNSIIGFSLFQGDQLIHSFPNAPNEGQTTITIPVSVKPGFDYYFRIADARNPDQVILTPLFRVKRKVPLGLKAVVVAGIGGAVYFLLSNDAAPQPLDSPPDVPPTK